MDSLLVDRIDRCKRKIRSNKVLYAESEDKTHAKLGFFCLAISILTQYTYNVQGSTKLSFRWLAAFHINAFGPATT